MWAIVACVPTHPIVRPAIDGIVTDADQTPVAYVRVEALSRARFRDLSRWETTLTAADGTFRLPAIRRWELCCLGEAAFPFTELRACTADRVARVTLGSERRAQVTLVLAPDPAGQCAEAIP